MVFHRRESRITALSERLDARRGDESSPASTVLLQVEKGVPVETQQAVAEMALQKGFRVWVLGQPEDAAPAATTPAPKPR